MTLASDKAQLLAIGLEAFVERLLTLGPASIAFCPVPLPSGVLTIALDEHRDDVVGITIARRDHLG